MADLTVQWFDSRKPLSRDTNFKREVQILLALPTVVFLMLHIYAGRRGEAAACLSKRELKRVWGLSSWLPLTNNMIIKILNTCNFGELYFLAQISILSRNREYLFSYNRVYITWSITVQKIINNTKDEFANKLDSASLQLHVRLKMCPGGRVTELDFFHFSYKDFILFFCCFCL